MKKRISIIRHGKTEGNLKRCFYGKTDLPLLNEGIDELVELEKKGIYPEVEDQELYTSGMTRTEQTFFVIYGNREHKVCKGLREMEFGEFEMKSHEDLKDRPEYQAWISEVERTMPVPGGESVQLFRKRVVKAFKELAKKDKDAIVICHGGVISMIMGSCFKEENPENMFNWLPNPGHGYTIEIEEDKPVGYEKI